MRLSTSLANLQHHSWSLLAIKGVEISLKAFITMQISVIWLYTETSLPLLFPFMDIPFGY